MSNYNNHDKTNNFVAPKADPRNDKHEGQNSTASHNENHPHAKGAQDTKTQPQGTVQQQGKFEHPDHATHTVGTPAKNPAPAHTNDKPVQAKPAQEKDDGKSCSIDHEKKPQK